MDAPPARGSENLGSLWQSSSRLLRLRRKLSLPNLFHKEQACPGQWVAQSSALCFPSNRSATAGTQASQGATAQTYSNSPSLEETAVGVRVIPAAWSKSVADPLEMLSMPLLLADRWAEIVRWLNFYKSSYSYTLGLTYRTKGPERAPVWTIAIHEPQSTLIKNHPAASTDVGQASRRPAGPIHQPGLPAIQAWKTKAGLCI